MKEAVTLRSGAPEDQSVEHPLVRALTLRSASILSGSRGEPVQSLDRARISISASTNRTPRSIEETAA
jgi:hypothetical protein